MKQKDTQKKSANRGPHKVHSGINSMSVADRRKRGWRTSDSDEYDRKHGIIGTGATPSPSVQNQRRAVTRRSQ